MGLFSAVFAASYFLMKGLVPRNNPKSYKFKKGKLTPSTTLYKESPFILDAIANSSSKFIVYDKGDSKPKGFAENSFRMLLPEGASLVVRALVSDLRYSPRFWLYDAERKLLPKGQELERNSKYLTYKFRIPKQGFYKLVSRFEYEDTSKIILGVLPDKTKPVTKEKLVIDYVNDALKKLEIDMSLPEKKAYADIKRKQLKLAQYYKRTPPPPDVLTRPYSQTQDRFIARIKGADKDGWSIANMGMAGRVLEHLNYSVDPNNLSSLDIEILG